MESIKEDKISKIIVHFSKDLNEEYMKNFAYKVGQILKAIATGKHAPVSVSGEADKVRAFAKAIGHEMKYINALESSNTGDPKVMDMRHALEESIKEFEKSTGIKWPVR
tara:strand:+ start:317 stop:643 length:327 start_codon:yes stop_codon:yes gene_type:complete